MIKPTYAAVKHMLHMLDWSGHVELPDADLEWLAEQLSARLSASSLEVCDSCGRSMTIVVTTKLGNICSDCLEEATDTADNIRDTLTGGGVDESGSTVSVARGHIQPVPTKVLL
jgi:hypothetical protein